MTELREVHQLEQLVDPGSISAFGPLADLQAEGDVLRHRHVLEGGVVLEDEADVALLRRQVGGLLALDVTVPASADSRPAMIRSRVDLPPPDGTEERGELPVGRDT